MFSMQGQHESYVPRYHPWRDEKCRAGSHIENVARFTSGTVPSQLTQFRGSQAANHLPKEGCPPFRPFIALAPLPLLAKDFDPFLPPFPFPELFLVSGCCCDFPLPLLLELFR